MHQGFLNAHIGHLLEIYQQLVSHVLQSRSLANLSQFGLGDLLVNLFFQLLQRIVALTPCGDVTLCQPEALPRGLPGSEIFDGLGVGAVLLAVHQGKDLHVLNIRQLTGPLLGQTEQPLEFTLRQQFLLGDTLQFNYGCFGQTGRELILDVVFELLDPLLTLMLKCREMKGRIFSLVFFDLVAEVQLLFALDQPGLDSSLALELGPSREDIGLCLAILEVDRIQRLPILQDDRIQESKPGQLYAGFLQFGQEGDHVALGLRRGVILFKQSQVLVQLDLRGDPVSDERATRAGASSPHTDQVVRFDGGGFTGEGPEQTLILFHADYKDGDRDQGGQGQSWCAEIVDKLVVNSIKRFYPLKKRLHLKGELVGQCPFCSQLDHHGFSLLILKAMPVRTHAIDLCHAHSLRLLVLCPQFTDQYFQLPHLFLQFEDRVSFVVQPSELLCQKLLPVLKLLKFEQVGLRYIITVLAAAEGFHEMDCSLVRVVGSFLHFELINQITYYIIYLIIYTYPYRSHLNMPSYLASFLQDYLWYHAVTLMVILIIAVLVLVHHLGSQQNERVMREAKQQLDPLLKKSFNQYDGELLVQSPNIIKLYPSGRESCLFAIFAFALVPRQQVLSFLFNSTFIKLKDELVIEIPILNEHPLSLTMAIIRRKNIKQLTKKKYPDIKQLCKEYKPIINTSLNVPETHSILVEKVEHFRYLLHNEEEVQLWKEHGRSVKLLYMSDVNSYSRYPMSVRMVINLGKDVVPLVGWLIGYVDRMAKTRMTSGERREARKRREGLNLRLE